MSVNVLCAVIAAIAVIAGAVRVCRLCGENDKDAGKRARIIRSIAAVLLILIIIGAVWYFIPVDMMNIEPDEVEKIVVFDGNTGNETEITNGKSIKKVVEAFNGVKLSRDGFSLGYMGYSYRVTVVMRDSGKEYEWTVNSADTARKDPFFYTAKEGDLPYDLIESLV